jgi:hypothetical protein
MNRKFKPAFFWPEIYGQRTAHVKKLLAYEKKLNEDLPRRPSRVAHTHAVAE